MLRLMRRPSALEVHRALSGHAAQRSARSRLRGDLAWLADSPDMIGEGPQLSCGFRAGHGRAMARRQYVRFKRRKCGN